MIGGSGSVDDAQHERANRLQRRYKLNPSVSFISTLNISIASCRCCSLVLAVDTSLSGGGKMAAGDEVYRETG